MMNQPQVTVALLNRCIVKQDSGPLMLHFKGMIIYFFREGTQPHLRTEYEQFLDWLPAWLLIGHKLERALSWLEKKAEDGASKSDNDQEDALKNYLAEVFKTGVIEFTRERIARSPGSRLSQAEEETLNEIKSRPDRVSEEQQTSKLMEKMKEMLVDKFEPGLRVPFWLRNYKALGPLQSEDLNWIVEKSGLPAVQIMQRIEEEVATHQKRYHALSAVVIGELCDISNTAAVDQRIHRVKTILIKATKDEDENL